MGPLARSGLFSLGLAARGLPLFSTFFLWSWGSGAQQLARPLFAASFDVPIVLVTLITSSNAISRTVTAPIIGYLADRWGRKPLLVGGVALRGVTTFLEFFSQSYLEFLVLEFIGGVGVSTWTTGGSILLADVTSVESRGRALAIRSISTRLGAILGPLTGAALATPFGIRAAFLFNSATKLAQLLVLVYLIRESRPEAARRSQMGSSRPGFNEAARLFLTRPFLLIAGVTVTTSMMGQGVFQAMFPVYLQGAVNLTTADIGVMVSLAGAITLLAAYPAGVVTDYYGRKRAMAPGLLALALSAYLLANVSDYRSVVIMVLVYGLGESAATGAAQAYVVDVAPEGSRGTYLGAWQLFNATGGIAAPLMIGLLADLVGFGPTFLATAGLLVLSALAMALWGPDFGGRRRRLQALPRLPDQGGPPGTAI